MIFAVVLVRNAKSENILKIQRELEVLFMSMKCVWIKMKVICQLKKMDQWFIWTKFPLYAFVLLLSRVNLTKVWSKPISGSGARILMTWVGTSLQAKCIIYQSFYYQFHSKVQSNWLMFNMSDYKWYLLLLIKLRNQISWKFWDLKVKSVIHGRSNLNQL